MGDGGRLAFGALLRAARPRQWVKNLLVFAVPLAAGQLLSPPTLLPAVVAFIVFCAASSATYLVNDALDVNSDREHPQKRHRPIASGDLGVRTAYVTAGLLAIVALSLAAAVNLGLLLVVLIYLATTIAYSMSLKHEPVVELAVLAAGFLLRAIAGGVAADLAVSPWFLIVAGFGALYVAAGKRYGELLLLEHQGIPAESARRSLSFYSVSYLRFVWQLAATVTVTGYCLWAFEVGAKQEQFSFAAVSTVPFVLALLRFGVDVDSGRAGQPEEIILSDKLLLTLGGLWVATFGIGAYLYPVTAY